MTDKVYGPYPVEYQGPGIHAGIMGELPPELVGKCVTLKVVDSLDMVAAIRTLHTLGYTYHGGEMWKPPLGLNKINRGRELFTAANPNVPWESLGHAQRDYWNKIYDSRKHSV